MKLINASAIAVLVLILIASVDLAQSRGRDRRLYDTLGEHLPPLVLLRFFLLLTVYAFGDVLQGCQKTLVKTRSSALTGRWHCELTMFSASVLAWLSNQLRAEICWGSASQHVPGELRPMRVKV